MHVRKSQVLLPIEVCNFVFAGVGVKGDGVDNRRVERRHLIRIESLFAEQTIDGSGRHGSEEFALRV